MVHQKDTWEAIPSTGGLVTALKAVKERRAFTWLGWPGTHVAEAEQAEVTRVLSKHGASPVFIGKAHLDGFYQNFSNGVLWPLFHNLPERSHFDLAGWKSYQTVNQMYADAICRTAKPGDAVWIHDYQLTLVPEYLRQRGLGCPIGFFLHIPFPSAETYRTLPVNERVLRGLLGADLLGFHAYEYVSHFRTACLRVLGLESDPETLSLPSRNVKLAVLPIGIDPHEIAQLVELDVAQNELLTLERAYAGKKIVVGVDRLDYTKGIPQKLAAFEELLRAHAKWRGKVVLIQIAAPSRTGVDEYRQLKRDVDELVGRINGRYGTPSYTPVVYINQSVPRERLCGLYRAADVALITPVRDGMNLVALEYVAARAGRGGTLILSEFTGAAHRLAGARLVNPHSTHDVARVLAESLESSPQSAEAFSHMETFVYENTSTQWANRFLDRLEDVSGQVRVPARLLDVDEPVLKQLIKRSQRPLFFLDYDGTLRSYVSDPKAAVPDTAILETLELLASVATVYIISGRAASALEDWLGHLKIGLVCEHGLAIKEPNGVWQNRANISGAALTRLVRPIFDDFVHHTPGSRVELKQAAIAWHYRAADPEYGAFQAGELLTRLEDVLKRRPYKVLRGSRVVEVRHELVTKGNAIKELLHRNAKADLLFCAGDDRTDEEMMAAIPDSWAAKTVTCWVGSRNVIAAYWCDSNQMLLDQLRVMAQRLGRTPPRRGRQSKALSRGSGRGRRGGTSAAPQSGISAWARSKQGGGVGKAVKAVVRRALRKKAGRAKKAP